MFYFQTKSLQEECGQWLEIVSEIHFEKGLTNKLSIILQNIKNSNSESSYPLLNIFFYLVFKSTRIYFEYLPFIKETEQYI